LKRRILFAGMILACASLQLTASGRTNKLRAELVPRWKINVVLEKKRRPDYPGRSGLQPLNPEELPMESLTKLRTVTVVGIFGVVAYCFLFLGVSHAEVPQKPSANQMQIQKKEPFSAPATIKGCPDLKVSLNVVKSGSGLVTLSGTVANVGSADYDLSSEAQVFMNLSYPPKTYNQVGVSEQLCTKAFTSVKKGASFPVNCSFQIPAFASWAAEAPPGNAKRLFTLRVVKRNMAPFTAAEDCNPDNNSKWVEVPYQEKRPLERLN